MEHPRIQVEQVGEDEWLLLRDLVWEGASQRFTVTAGFVTNFASVPRPLWWLVPRTGRHTWAVVLHDALWCESQRPAAQRQVDPWDADGIFRRTLKESGVPQVRRYLMWAAVRSAAVVRGRFGRVGPLQVVPLALIVVPSVVLLAPAALAVVVSLVVLWLVEWVARLVLAAAGVSRRRPRLFWVARRPSQREPAGGDCHLVVESLL